MYKYQGNTGRYVRIPDASRQEQSRRDPERNRPMPSPAQQGKEPEKTVPLPLDLGSGLNDILSSVFPDGFEMEDILLLLILLLMYKESGDKELLVIMGAMFLL